MPSLPLAFRFFLSLIPAIAGAQALTYPGCGELQDSEFRKVPVISEGVSMSTKFVIAPDGRLLLAGQSGQLTWIDAKTGSTTDAGKVPDVGSGIWGLTGLTFDPDFRTNGRLFLYCTRPVATDSSVSSIRRITLKENKIDPASVKVLLEWPVTRTGIDHSGGGVAFDPAGNLYVGTGDNSNWTLEYGSISEANVKLNSLRSAANTNDLRGKMIRIKPKPLAESDPSPTPGIGTTYDIPAGNLFPVGTAQTLPEIYTMGQRNPFSIAIDPVTGWLFVADIGAQAANASTTKGPAANDEFNLVKQAGNYGWPMFTGPNVPYNKYDYVANTTGPLFDSANPVNDSKFNTGLQKLPLPRGSLVNYSKDGKNMVWTGFEKGAIACIGGPVYRYGDYGGSTVKLPPHFDGKWIVSDYQQGWIKAIAFDETGTKALAVQALFENLAFSGSIIDMKLGPDGALYVMELGRSISRIEYTGTCRPAVGPVLSRHGDARGSRRSFTHGQHSLLLPAGSRGFSLFNLQGRKVWSFFRKEISTAHSTPLPESLRGEILRIRWE